MPRINDLDMSIFQEAGIPAIDNFTSEELETIGGLAKQLKAIMGAAKERQQQALEKVRRR
jgi:uncharacterized coiled-coil protein SlyX